MIKVIPIRPFVGNRVLKTNQNENTKTIKADLLRISANEYQYTEILQVLPFKLFYHNILWFSVIFLAQANICQAKFVHPHGRIEKITCTKEYDKIFLMWPPSLNKM